MLIIAFFLSLFVFIFSIKRWKYFFESGISPTVLYSALWGIIYFVHIINPLNYLTISNYAIVLSLIPLIAIFIGEHLAYPSKKLNLIFIYRSPNQRFKRIILFLGIVVFIAGILLFYVATIKFGKFWDSSAAVKLKHARSLLGSKAFAGTRFGIIAKYFDLLSSLAMVTFVLSLSYNFFSKKKSWVISFLPFFAIVLFDISWGARSHIAKMVVLYFLFNLIIYTKKSNLLSIKNLIFVSFVIGMFFVITLSTRKINQIEVNGKYYPRTIIQIVDYSVGPIIAFDKEIKNAKTTYGRLSFYGVESFFRIFKLFSAPPPKQFIEIEENTVKISKSYTYLRTLNTYSWLLYLYYDFNVFGLFVIPFIISFIITKQFTKFIYYKQKKLVRSVLVVYLYSILFSSITVFSFNLLGFVFSLFILMVLLLFEKVKGFRLYY